VRATSLALAKILEDNAGSLALAAYELATTRLAPRAQARVTPTSREIWTAAQEIAVCTGWIDPVPPHFLLAADCKRAGLLVEPG
jgi:hypothetical protein